MQNLADRNLLQYVSMVSLGDIAEFQTTQRYDAVFVDALHDEREIATNMPRVGSLLTKEFIFVGTILFVMIPQRRCLVISAMLPIGPSYRGIRPVCEAWGLLDLRPRGRRSSCHWHLSAASLRWPAPKSALRCGCQRPRWLGRLPASKLHRLSMREIAAVRCSGRGPLLGEAALSTDWRPRCRTELRIVVVGEANGQVARFRVLKLTTAVDTTPLTQSLSNTDAV